LLKGRGKETGRDLSLALFFVSCEGDAPELERVGVLVVRRKEGVIFGWAVAARLEERRTQRRLGEVLEHFDLPARIRGDDVHQLFLVG